MKKNKIMKSKKDTSISSNYYESTDFSEVMKTSKKKKISALMTETYLTERAAKGSRENFLDIMSRVPDTPPDTRDKIVN